MLDKRLPWHSADEDALSEAMEHAHSMGKTPLLLDGTVRTGESDETKLDVRLAERAEVLEARKMREDEITGERTRDLIMKEARKQVSKHSARAQRASTVLEHLRYNLSQDLWRGACRT